MSSTSRYRPMQPTPNKHYEKFYNDTRKLLQTLDAMIHRLSHGFHGLNGPLMMIALVISMRPLSD